MYSLGLKVDYGLNRTIPFISKAVQNMITICMLTTFELNCKYSWQNKAIQSFRKQKKKVIIFQASSKDSLLNNIMKWGQNWRTGRNNSLFRTEVSSQVDSLLHSSTLSTNVLHILYQCSSVGAFLIAPGISDHKYYSLFIAASDSLKPARLKDYFLPIRT